MPGLPDISLPDRLCLPFVCVRDRRRILTAQAPVGNRLSEPVRRTSLPQFIHWKDP
jgi:hypothetical protein